MAKNNKPTTPPAEANPLEEKVQVLEHQLKQALSDYHNLQREHQREKDVLTESLRRRIFRDLIDLFTDLNLAVNKMNEVSPDNPWMAGILQIMNKYQALLKTNGITEFAFNTGDPIDYNRCQIIGTLPEGQANTIAQTAEPGFQSGEFVISPAKVIVFSGVPAKPAAATDEPTEPKTN